MRRIADACAVATLIGALLVVSVRGQSQPPPRPSEDQGFRFKTGVELINVTASVSDSTGRFVSGLTANDFGKIDQYGDLFKSTYLLFGGGGATVDRYNNFQNALGTNPCPA